MRNIAEIIEDDKNGKQLSQTERQIAVAYIQGKYDAVRQFKFCNNSNAMDVLDKIRDEIDSHCSDNRDRNDGLYIAMKIIDKYNAEGEE